LPIWSGSFSLSAAQTDKAAKERRAHPAAERRANFRIFSEEDRKEAGACIINQLLSLLEVK
jgi:hypothetical protein